MPRHKPKESKYAYHEIMFKDNNRQGKQRAISNSSFASHAISSGKERNNKLENKRQMTTGTSL
jgi:hypothetical protein